jgi:thiol:disulfide interchange protein
MVEIQARLKYFDDELKKVTMELEKVHREEQWLLEKIEKLNMMIRSSHSAIFSTWKNIISLVMLIASILGIKWILQQGYPLHRGELICCVVIILAVILYWVIRTMAFSHVKKAREKTRERLQKELVRFREEKMNPAIQKMERLKEDYCRISDLLEHDFVI